MMMRGWIISFLLLVPISITAVAQTSSSAPALAAPAAAVAPAMPKDANAAMLLAARVNGLAGLDKPWHLKANYQTFDADGKPKDQGVFEEWWAGPEKWKVSYDDADFSQVEYRNGATELVSGDAGWVPWAESVVKQFLDSPTPSEDLFKKGKYSFFDTKIGGIALTCLRPIAAPLSPIPPTICLDEKSFAVRVRSDYGGLNSEFNDLVLVDGHYLAKQISIANSGLAVAKVDVTALDYPAKITDSDIAAPESARTAPYTPSYPGLTGGHRSQFIFIPRTASGWSNRGMVIVEMTTTKEGTTSDLQVVSGPKTLRDTAVTDLRRWRYTPYRLNGRPVDVRGTIFMVYKSTPADGVWVY